LTSGEGEIGRMSLLQQLLTPLERAGMEDLSLVVESTEEE